MVGENRKIEMRTQEKTVDRLVLLRLYWWKFRPFSITGANGPCRPDGESAHHLRGKLWDPFSTKMMVSRFCNGTTDAPVYSVVPACHMTPENETNRVQHYWDTSSRLRTGDDAGIYLFSKEQYTRYIFEIQVTCANRKPVRLRRRIDDAVCDTAGKL